MKTKITDFTFISQGLGFYKVIYTCPESGIKWSSVVYDMNLIVSTKNTSTPTDKNLERLKKLVKGN